MASKRPTKRGAARKPSKKRASKAAGKAAGNAAVKSPRKTGGAWDAAFAPRQPGEQRYWLVKSEPDVFSFDDLLRVHNKTTQWNGVRNFAARNFMKEGMKLGDRVFYYHSMSDAQAIVGICEVVRESYPDDSAFDPRGGGYDPKSDRAKPTWYMVDLRAVAQFTRPVTLAEIKTRKELKDMAILRIGRLSVTPVTRREWDTICALAG